MKKILAIAILVNLQLAIFNSAFAQQTYTQQVPDDVTEIIIEDYAHLVVKATDGPTMLQSFSKNGVASVKKGRMTISDCPYDVTLLLPAGRNMAFTVEDYANLRFNGSFGKRQQLTIHTEDYSSAIFSGSLEDSMWAVNLTLHSEDYSKIFSEIKLLCHNYSFTYEDYSYIRLACLNEKIESSIAERVQSVRFDPDSFAQLDFNYCHQDTVMPVNHAGVSASGAVQGKYGSSGQDDVRPEKKRSIWYRRDVTVNFAWGFHNWGSERLNGFGGVEGDAAIRTSFNNIQLSVNYPIVGTRHIGFYVGLGLEWDKYKFEGHEIAFNTGVNPHTFAEGGDLTCATRLNTRYVILPVTLHFDLWREWSLAFSAIPGIHWGGSHTGLRREYETALEERIEYDQSVNRYINPYKMDLRVMLSYGGLGIYVQVPTMSGMRENSQPLYPIKFGLDFKLD